MSRFRWQNGYHFGDFHGSEATLLKYYDAHFTDTADREEEANQDEVQDEVRDKVTGQM